MNRERLGYLAEVQLIQEKWGDIEAIRHRLGLSQRKICQLLLVDPSAWTRWLKSEPPPWVYRALSWYLVATEQHPEIANPYFWMSQAARSEPKKQASNEILQKVQWKELEKDFSSQLDDLKEQLKTDYNLKLAKLAHRMSEAQRTPFAGPQHSSKVFIFLGILLALSLALNLLFFLD